MTNDIEIMQSLVEEDLELMREVIQEDLLPLIQFREKLEKQAFNKAYEEMQRLEKEEV